MLEKRTNWAYNEHSNLAAYHENSELQMSSGRGRSHGGICASESLPATIENDIRIQKTFPPYRASLFHFDYTKASPPMSLIIAYVAQDGLVVASDSRRTFISDKSIGYRPKPQYFDDEQKIFPIPGTNILMTATGTCRFGANGDIRYQEILEKADVQNRPIADIAWRVYHTIREIAQNPTIYVSFLQPFRDECNIMSVRRYVIESGPAGSLCISQYPDAITEKTWQHGESWAVNYAQYISYQYGTVQEIIPQVRTAMQTIIEICGKLDENARVIGGKCAIAAANEKDAWLVR